MTSFLCATQCASVSLGVSFYFTQTHRPFCCAADPGGAAIKQNAADAAVLYYLFIHSSAM
jgi:hypothetical protein